jgi:thiazolinyl imide reductase
MVEGILRGVPTTLRIQNQMDPTDPDSHAHQLHRITIGFEGGHLTLADTHGPVLWCPRPNMPRETEDSVTLHDVAVDYLDHPTATVLGPTEMPTYRSVLSRAWPDAIQVELAALLEDAGRRDRLDRHHLQAHLTTARVWQDMTAGLGYPDLLDGDPPRPRAADDLTQLAELADVEQLVEVGT